jgi:hypothetical protein
VIIVVVVGIATIAVAVVLLLWLLSLPSPPLSLLLPSPSLSNVKRYLINHLISTMLSRQCFVFFPSKDRATPPGQCEYKRSYS